MPKKKIDLKKTKEELILELERSRIEIADLKGKNVSSKQAVELISLYEKIVKKIPLGLHIYHLENIDDDQSLRMIFANSASEVLTGIKIENVVGKTLDQNFPGLHKQGIPQIYAEVARSNESKNIGNVYYGDKRVDQGRFSVKVFPLHGNCVGVSFENTTEQKKAEDKLLKERYYLEKTQEIAKIGIWELDIQRNILLWTDETYKIFNVPVGTKLNIKSFFSCVHTEDRNYVNEKWNDALNKEPYDIEHRILIDGDIKWVREKAEIEFDADGNPISAIGFVQDITKQKKTEEILKENEDKYRTLYNNAPLSYQSLNKDGCFLDINPTWLKTLGYDREEVIGKKFKDFLHPDWQPHFEKNFPAFKKRGYVNDVQFKIRHKKEHYLDISFEGCIGNNPDGSFKQTYCVFNDITKQKKAEKTLQESELKFRLLADYTYDWEYWIDLDGNYTYLSPSCERISGYTKEEFISDPELLFKIVLPEYKEEVLHHYKNERKNMVDTLSFEFKFITRDGKESWIEHNCCPLFNKLGKFIGRRGNNRDITERVQADKMLKTSEERYKGIIQNTTNCIAVYRAVDDGKDFVFVEFNPMAEKTENTTKKEVIGKKVTEVFPGVSDLGLLKVFQDVYRSGTAQHLPIEIYKDKRVQGYRENYIYKLHSGEIVAVYRDLTEEKKLENEKVHLQEQLIQAQKMEAIGTLAGGIAHDFNNILGVIIGYTELTLDDPGNIKNIVYNLQHVMKASDRAKDMVKQILTFSRKDDQSMKPVNVGNVIKEIITFLRSTIPTTIEIRSTVAKNFGLIFGNATQINQVLMNLCTNASHAMVEKGGVLKINLQEVTLDKDSSLIVNLEPGTYLHLIVSDTGTGMSKEVLKRIFEPYYTTKKNGEGTGMGLAVIYGIVNSHNGNIKVRSEIGTGSVFNIYFPVLESEKILDVYEDQKTALMGNEEKILFVDDENPLAELGTKMLEKLGYQVESRTSSIEALEAFKANIDKFDLIITDMTMPNMTGIKLAAEVHKIRPDIPVVLCTGFSDSINKSNYKSLGISALIMKPVIKKALAETVREVLEKKEL